MRHFRLIFAPLVLVAMFALFFTRTASAQSLPSAQAQPTSHVMPNSCSVTEASSNIYDGAEYLGFTWLVVNNCTAESFEETQVTGGLYSYVYSAISNGSTSTNTGYPSTA